MNVVGEVTSRTNEKAPFVRFERRAIEDVPASVAAGQYVAKDVDYALVTAPYSKDVFPTPVSEWFAQIKVDAAAGRFPADLIDRFQKQYGAWKSGQELPLDGTPIKGWGVISPAIQETLIAMHIQTVEEAAQMNDEALKRIGMGAVDVRNKARAWLAQMNDKGAITMQMAALQSQNTVLLSQVEVLSKQVETLLEAKKIEQPRREQNIQNIPSVQAISAADILEPATHEELVAAYTAKFGSPPHHRMKDETMVERLK